MKYKTKPGLSYHIQKTHGKNRRFNDVTEHLVTIFPPFSLHQQAE